jgi:hypothetical protein
LFLGLVVSPAAGLVFMASLFRGAKFGINAKFDRCYVVSS